MVTAEAGIKSVYDVLKETAKGHYSGDVDFGHLITYAHAVEAIETYAKQFKQ